MTNFSKTSAQGWEAVSKVDQGPDTRPDASPPVSGRTSRRKSPNLVYVGDLLWSLPAGLEMGTWRPPVQLWRVGAVHPIVKVEQA